MAYNFSNVSVLVVETSSEMFALTEAVLKTFGIDRIHAAYGFDEGFEAYCSLTPDIVMTDWLQDPRNGLELTKKIRTHPDSPNPFTPVILMTGHSVRKRVFMARDSGVTSFIVKPFTAKLLYQRIEQMAERPQRFVRNEQFFGPDRRQSRGNAYAGQERRSDGSITEVTITADQLAQNIRRRKQRRNDSKQEEENGRS